MKKKKYVQPECDIVYSYDLESELMYGNGLGGDITNGPSLGFPTGSNPGSGGGGGGDSSSFTDEGNSELSKGNNLWGNIWED